MMTMPERIISSRSRINLRRTPRTHPILRHLEKEKVSEDVRPAAEKEKERAKERGKADPFLGRELIPQHQTRAEIKVKITVQSASLSAEISALIAKKIANAATYL